MCFHMACFDDQKIEAMGLPNSQFFKLLGY
jgi:hypothetical protein